LQCQAQPAWFLLGLPAYVLGSARNIPYKLMGIMMLK
jgi:hypothetical protein